MRSSISCLTLAAGGNGSAGAWAKAVIPPTSPPTRKMPIHGGFIAILKAIIVVYGFEVKRRRLRLRTADSQQLDLEDERSAGRNHRRTSAITISDIRRAYQSGLPTHLH